MYLFYFLEVWVAVVSSTYQLTKLKWFEESIAKLFWSTNTKNMSPDFVFFVRQIFVLDWLMTLVFSTYQLSFGKFLLPNFLRAFAVAKKSSNFVFFVGTRTPLVELVEIHHTEEKNSRKSIFVGSLAIVGRITVRTSGTKSLWFVKKSTKKSQMRSWICKE